jgi:hypothetical protein
MDIINNITPSVPESDIRIIWDDSHMIARFEHNWTTTDTSRKYDLQLQHKSLTSSYKTNVKYDSAVTGHIDTN